MKFILLLLLLSSCGSAYHVRKFKKHLSLAVEKGASIDSIYQVKHDTVKLETIRDSLVMKLEVDTIRVRELCDSIRESPTRAITRLKQIFSNPVAIDTTYTVNIVTEDTVYKLPITVHILNTPDQFEYWIHSDSLKIPVKKEEIGITVKPQTRIPWWIWVIIGGLILTLIFKK